MNPIGPVQARIASPTVARGRATSGEAMAEAPLQEDVCTLTRQPRDERFLLATPPTSAASVNALVSGSPTTSTASVSAVVSGSPTTGAAGALAAVAPGTIAAASVSAVVSGTPLPLLPFTRATRYVSGENGERMRQDLHCVRDDYRRRTDSQGREWQMFTALDRGYVLRVLDGQGEVRLNLDFNATFGNSGLEGWLQDAALDPDRQRLYTLNRNALHAFDLATGTEVGRVSRADQHDLGSIHVTRDGRLFSSDRHSLVEFTPDLAEVRRVPAEGFIPERIEDLPNGDVVALGALFEKDGTVYAGYETHRMVVSPTGQVRLVDHNGENAPATLGADGAYWFMEKGQKAVHRLDLATGEARRMSVDVPMDRIVPRPDGSFLTLQAAWSGVTVSVCDARGRRVDQFQFKAPYTDLYSLTLSPDGESAYLMLRCSYDTGKGSDHDLFRLDLHRDLAGRTWDRLTAHKDAQPGSLIHASATDSLPMVLADGRLLVFEPGKADLLDSEGRLLHTYSSWREARADLGSAFCSATGSFPVGDYAPRPENSSAQAWERVLVDRETPTSPRMACGPLTPVGSTPVPSLPAHAPSVEEGLQKLWDPFDGRVTQFPVSSDTTMEFRPERIVVARSEEPVTALSLPRGDAKFTDAMALNVGPMPFVLAGTDGGHVCFGRVDYKYGGEVAGVYPVGSGVTRVGLADHGQIVVEDASGTTALVITPPLQPGEELRAGGTSTTGTEARDNVGGIEKDADEVIINGVRIPRRQYEMLIAR